MRIIPYILYLFLITFFNTILSDLISIYGVSINLAVMIVVMIGFYKNETESLWFGVSAGLVAGAVHLEWMPWEVLLMAIIAVTVKQVSSRINLESLASKVLVLACAVLFYGIVETLVVSSEGFFYLLIRYVIPGTVYTAIIGWLFFMIKDGRISWQKFKALF